MKEREQREKRKPVLRKDFGPGELGQKLYDWIKTGVPCESIIDIKITCGINSVGTVDVDSGASLVTIPYCSEEHAQKIEVKVLKDLGGAENKKNSIRRNGYGRA